jgi:competence protein ComEC
MLRQLPTLKILLPLICGIGCALYFPNTISLNILAFIFGIVVALLISLRLVTQLKATSISRGAVIFLFIAVSGALLTKLRHNSYSKFHYSNYLSKVKSFEVEIIEPIIKKTKSYKTTVRVHTCLPSGINTNGDLILYFTKHEQQPTLQPGMRLLVNANLLSIINNGNLGEFDYKEYCLRKNITHMAFVQPKSYTTLPTKSMSWHARFSLWRMHTLARLRKFITDSRAVGIAEALLVGDKSDIDQETWDNYSRAGIVHIIAISGMHMGIVYSGILALLGVMPVLKHQRKTNILISLIAMWLFACVTGMPASVMRASVMFSFLGISEMLGRSKNSFNVLSASAIVLLFYNPVWLLDIGFILSYAAILGIMIFSPRWNQVAASKPKAQRILWQFITGTTAAQIFTFPICLYYFGQFPMLFLLSNMVAIPATALILYILIAILLTSVIPTMASVLGAIASFLIVQLNLIIGAMGSISFFSVYNIEINYLQMLLLLIAVSTIAIAIFYKNKHALVTALTCSLVFWLVKINHTKKYAMQKALVVYNVRQKTAIEFTEGIYHQAILSNNFTAGDEKNALWSTHKVWHLTTETDRLSLPTGTSMFKKNDKIILTLDSTKNFAEQQIKADIIILCGNCKLSLADVYNHYQARIIVADASNSMWKIEQWQKEASTLPLRFHSTSKNGAFVHIL